MKIIKISSILFGTILCLLIILTNRVTADNISFNGDIVYTDSKSQLVGRLTRRTGLSQVYSLALNKTFTKAIRAWGDIRTSQNVTDSNESSSIDPSLFLSLDNEYFNSNIGYQVNDRFLSAGNKVTTVSRNTNFLTAPSEFPSLKFTYNDSQVKDQLPIRLIDASQSYMNVGTDYIINDVTLIYNYTSSASENYVLQMKQDNPTHLGTVIYGTSFFDNKLNIDMNISGTRASSINMSLSGTPQIFPEEKAATNGLYKIDALPADGQLDDYPALIDDDKSSDTGINLNDSNRNIGIKFSDVKKIDTIYLYVSTADEQTRKNLTSMNFGWSVYSGDNSGNIWTTVTLFSTSYDEVNNRFKLVFSLPVEAIFFKAVNMTYDSSAQTISVTEIEVYGSITETPSVTTETTTDRQYGGVNLGFKPTKKVNILYNINYDQSKESRNNTEDKNINQGLSLSYAVSKYVSLFSNYQNQSIESTSGRDVGFNNYSLSLSTNPIETINSSFAVNHSESLTAKSITSESDSGNINMFFKLYPGVDMGTGLSMGKLKDIVNKIDTASNSVSGNLSLLPWKTVNILIDGAFLSSTSDAKGEKISSKSESLRSTINITPSRHINLVVNLQYLPQMKQNYSVNTRLPGSLQINANYNVSEGGAETIGSSVYWNISRYLYISSTYSVSLLHNVTDDKTDLFSMAFSIRR